MTHITIRRALLALVMPLATLGLASPALATEHHPTGEFAPFAECPLSTAGLSDCVLAESSAGEFTVGNRTVPIKSTITLQGGFIEERNRAQIRRRRKRRHAVENAAVRPGRAVQHRGPRTTSTKNRKNALKNSSTKGITGVTETTELAGPASDIGLSTENLLFEEGHGARRCR